MKVTNARLESLQEACIMNVIKMRLQVIKFDIQESVRFVIHGAMYKYIVELSWHCRRDRTKMITGFVSEYSMMTK
jgi:hypothetical protein